MRLTIELPSRIVGVRVVRVLLDEEEFWRAKIGRDIDVCAASKRAAIAVAILLAAEVDTTDLAEIRGTLLRLL